MNRPALFRADIWKAAAYLGSYPVVGAILFLITMATSLLGWVLSAVWLGLPIVVIAAVVIRGSAEAERLRLRLFAPGTDITANYREPDSQRIFTQIRTRWTDPSTMRNLAYLVLLFPPLLILDAATLLVWLCCLGLATLPLWYWSIPHTLADGSVIHGFNIGQQPLGPVGFWIDDLPSALLAALIGLVLALPVSELVLRVARCHALVARILLGRYTHPLTPARQILDQPGPLHRF